MHTVIENEAPVRSESEKAMWWETLRERCNTIGERAALDEAMREAERRAS